MLDKLKQEALKQGMKLMTNPKFMKMMADPRLMTALTRGYALKGKIESEIECGIRSLATSLNLATKEEVHDLQQTVRRVESKVTDLGSSLSEHAGEDHSGS